MSFANVQGLAVGIPKLPVAVQLCRRIEIFLQHMLGQQGVLHCTGGMIDGFRVIGAAMGTHHCIAGDSPVQPSIVLRGEHG